MASRLFLACLFLACLDGCATSDDGPTQTVLREVRLDETARFGALKATPSAVVEDSRCPLDVQCIQAGTVRIEVRTVDGGAPRTAVLDLGEPVSLGNGWVSLVSACPARVHAVPIEPRDYRFTLMLSTAAMPPLIDAPGCPAR